MPPTTKRDSVAPTNNKETQIPSLAADLVSPKAAVRTRARKALVSVGKPAVPSLIQLLSHAKPHVRWEAAKTLCDIRDPLAAFALVNTLADPDCDVRWLAAEALAALRRDGLQPLLAALLERAQSCWLCEGAHHVCHALVKRRELGPILRPVLAALNESERELAVPPAAYAALSKLRAKS
jgi:HEAT repeat protein